ncbi:MAG: peptidoglycan-binding protein [Anaerolineaceae bacterium]|nr:peptidoglycan-binding protein [Anaerolineaceae bacterium]
MRSGSRGQPVIELQTRLNRWLTSQGRQTLTVDGVFGQRTKSAVKAFQGAVHLRRDGIVCPNTRSVLVRNW